MWKTSRSGVRNNSSSSAVLVAAVLALAGVVSFDGLAAPDEDGKPFKRLVFDIGGELATEAPGIAVDGKRAAYSFKNEIVLLNIETGERMASHDLLGGQRAQGDVEACLLALKGTVVYARARYYTDPDRPPPDGGVGLVGGIEAGHTTVVSVDLASPDAKPAKLVSLPAGAKVADTLMGDQLVYTRGNKLHVHRVDAPDTGAVLKLNDRPIRRPLIQGDGALVVCDTSLYVYSKDGPRLEQVVYKDSPLAAMVNRKTLSVAKRGELVIGCTGSETVAFEPNGKKLWSAPFSGKIALGPKGEICVVSSMIHAVGLSPENGEPLWQQVFRHENWSGSNRLRGVDICDGRLAIVSERLICVLDPGTGKVLVDLPVDRDLKRDSYNIYQTLIRMTGSRGVLMVGFEESVYGLSLTPTAQVAAEWQLHDPANAESDIRAVSSLAENEQRKVLLRIGRNVRDTPGKVTRVMRLVDPHLRKDQSIVNAYCWVDDPMVLEALHKALSNEDVIKWYGTYVGTMLRCYPDQAAAEGVLRMILQQPDKYPVAARKVAAEHLRKKMKPDAGAEDLQLVYGVDDAQLAGVLKRKLASTDPADRKHALALLALAPDRVIVGLAGELKSLKKLDESGQARKLLAEATARQAAISRTGLKPEQAGSEGGNP